MTAGARPVFAPWTDPAAKPLVRFEAVSKRFGNFVAVGEVTLDIYEREFFALLGPSGCGKTTLLRMLAGFEHPSSGRVLLDGQDIAGVPPYLRPVNMMFQSYALFPHMTVEGNVAFGLKQEAMPKPEMDARVREMLALVKLEGFGHRRPHQLSGGQRQRVALARALAKRPRVLLLDEPLSALDRKLREETRFELMELQERLGLTFIVVTHDQDEAMSLADRIGVMNAGRLVQVAPAGRSALCATVWVGLRPEKIRIEPLSGAVTGDNSFAGQVVDIGYLGDVSIYKVNLDSGLVLKVTTANRTRLIERPISWNDRVSVNWPPEAGVVLTQ